MLDAGRAEVTAGVPNPGADAEVGPERGLQRPLWKAWELGMLQSGPLSALTHQLPVAVMIMRRRYRPSPCPVRATLLMASDRQLDAAESNAWSALFPAAGWIVHSPFNGSARACVQML